MTSEFRVLDFHIYIRIGVGRHFSCLLIKCDDESPLTQGCQTCGQPITSLRTSRWSYCSYRKWRHSVLNIYIFFNLKHFSSARLCCFVTSCSVRQRQIAANWVWVSNYISILLLKLWSVRNRVHIFGANSYPVSSLNWLAIRLELNQALYVYRNTEARSCIIVIVEKQ
jgi:hypothetical protein